MVPTLCLLYIKLIYTTFVIVTFLVCINFNILKLCVLHMKYSFEKRGEKIYRHSLSEPNTTKSICFDQLKYRIKNWIPASKVSVADLLNNIYHFDMIASCPRVTSTT
jgi:hypothetical protein